MEFHEIQKITTTQGKRPFLTCPILALDPGETTGVARFHYNKTSEIWHMYPSQLATPDIPSFIQLMQSQLDQYNPAIIVMEDYRVYSWKTKDHAWSDLHTPKIVAAMEVLCLQQNIPLHKQMAQQAKGFCTNDKLKQWGFYQPGQRHAVDAIRHGCYFLLFNSHKIKPGSH